MKAALQQLMNDAIAALAGDVLPSEAQTSTIGLERTRDRNHGDFASNAAMVLAPKAGMKPRDLAARIVAALPASDLLSKVEIAGPGFINFHLSPAAYHATVRAALESGREFGQGDLGAGQKVILEFVSANPTGPLHVGHGRGAAYGASLGNVLGAAGFDVHREYYINDAGRQMDILAASVYLRYLEHGGQTLRFPDNGYRGAYVNDIAQALHTEHGARFVHGVDALFGDVPPDAAQGGDKEAHIDALVANTKTLLGADYAAVFDAGLNAILEDIRQDLAEFGVTYDRWYSERELVASGAVEATLAELKQAGHIYSQDGAQWFRSTDFGDEKDRVVVRENGVATYFASDIAYHREKRQRGFDQLIDVWGADHHGYVPRVKGALKAVGEDPDRLHVLLVQFAILYRGKEKVSMSTRAGEFVTLRELREEVGNDAARFFYVLRSQDQHLDFDLELAKSESTDNPVYYVQYAHARICSVFNQLTEQGRSFDRNAGEASLALLDNDHEQALITALSRYPEIIEAAARNFAPHLLAYYLRELAQSFHTYYNAHTFLVDEDALRNARLCLIAATRQVLRNGLNLLGVSAPESM